jgi:hypothetical protein
MADDPIQHALEQIAFHEAEAFRLKTYVNYGDTLIGKEPRFPEAAAEMPHGAITSSPSRRSPSTRRWQEGTFFNKPLAGAVRTILEAAYEAAGAASPASVDEIHEALTQGSYDFGTNDIEAQKHGVRTSIGKNSVTFVKLPNSDKFGLVDWYGARARRVVRPRLNSDQSAEASADVEDSGVEEAAAEQPAAETVRRRQTEGG